MIIDSNMLRATHLTDGSKALFTNSYQRNPRGESQKTPGGNRWKSLKSRECRTLNSSKRQKNSIGQSQKKWVRTEDAEVRL